MFYEDKNGFHFRSIESMLAMGGSVARPTRWNFQTQIQMVQDTPKDEVKNIERYEGEHLTYTILTKNSNFYAGGVLAHSEIKASMEIIPK